MEQKLTPKDTPSFSSGLVTFPNPFIVPVDGSPSCLNVKWSVGGVVEKRLGSITTNATALVSASATGFSPDSGGTLATNLKAYWKLDLSTDVRLDSFGTTDLNNNSVAAGSGIILQAGSFIQVQSAHLYRASTDTLVTGSSNWSWVGWIYLTDTVGAADPFGNLRPIAEKETDYRLFVQTLHTGSGNRIHLQVSSDNTSYQTIVSANSFGALNTSTWYHVVAWHDSSNAQLGLSVNLATNSSSYTFGIKAGTGNYYVGGQTGASAISFWNGLIDEVGFWKTVLNKQQRSDLYNSGNANTYDKGVSTSGWGMFDFGAGFAGGLPLRHLVVAAGTGVYASSNRGVTFVVVATDRGANYQFFTRSKSFLIATSDTYNKVLYWAGSVGTFMAALAPNSAPPVKHALDFAGFLLLMNDSAGKRLVTYADNTKLLTDPYTSTFEIPSSLDDEITGGIEYNRSAYIFTKYTVNRVSHVGGNPDFSVLPVKAWGAVPGTIKKVTYKEIGEVVISLGWDRHVRIFDGSEDTIISTSIEENNNQAEVFLSGIPFDSIPKCRAEVDTEEQVYRLFLVMSPSQQTTHCICLNLRTGAWYPYDNQGFNAAVMAESSNSRILMGIKRDGFVHWINTSNTDMSVAVNDYLDSPLSFEQNPRVLSKGHKLALYFQATSSGSIYFQDRTNFSSTFFNRDRIILSDSTSVIQLKKVVDVPVTQNVYQWRVTSLSNTNTPWKLSRVSYEQEAFGYGDAG